MILEDGKAVKRKTDRNPERIPLKRPLWTAARVQANHGIHPSFTGQMPEAVYLAGFFGKSPQ